MTVTYFSNYSNIKTKDRFLETEIQVWLCILHITKFINVITGKPQLTIKLTRENNLLLDSSKIPGAYSYCIYLSLWSYVYLMRAWSAALQRHQQQHLPLPVRFLFPITAFHSSTFSFSTASLFLFFVFKCSYSHDIAHTIFTLSSSLYSLLHYSWVFFSPPTS